MKAFLLTLCALFIIVTCKAQDTLNNREFVSKEFNWKITIPEKFVTVPSEVWDEFQNKGTKAIESVYGGKVVNNAKIIFVFKSDGANCFEADSQPFDVKKDGDFSKSFKSVNEVLYTTFKAQIPNAKIDTASLLTEISNLTFNTFVLRLEISGAVVFNVYSFTRLFDGKKFCLYITYIDNKKGDQMLSAWKSSTFGQ